ncbi:MAG: hypothetical protein ACREFI_17905, partial [Stellaceae bacterium]
IWPRENKGGIKSVTSLESRRALLCRPYSRPRTSFIDFRCREAAEGHEPIFRIAQVRRDHWVVERPGASIEHAFADLEEVVAFIRNDSATPATVELRIGDFYVAARFDPLHSGSLFGEGAP